MTQQQISKMKRNLEAWGTVVAPYIVHGRPRLLTEVIEKALTNWLDKKPLSYLFEVVYFLYDIYSLTLGESTVHDTLRRYN